jgi:hypothetical protein
VPRQTNFIRNPDRGTIIAHLALPKYYCARITARGFDQDTDELAQGLRAVAVVLNECEDIYEGRRKEGRHSIGIKCAGIYMNWRARE